MPTYANILVHLDHSKHCAARIDVACKLALDFEAHLIGLYAIDSLEDVGHGVALSPGPTLGRIRLVSPEPERIGNLFEDRVRRAGVDRRETRQALGDAAKNVAFQANYSDLVVLGQGDPDERLTGVTPVFPQSVLLAAGAPVLVVPYFTDSFNSLGQRVLIAWDGGREAARAVKDALPLLTRARDVCTLSIASKAEKEDVASPSIDLAAYLAHHGVRAEATRTFAGDLAAGDTLLARMSDYGADLVVMGAYGHSRVRELVLGGVTRNMLSHMTAPVLMSH
jgi:nucleotide-binding universal stress UspA family protein